MSSRTDPFRVPSANCSSAAQHVYSSFIKGSSQPNSGPSLVLSSSTRSTRLFESSYCSLPPTMTVETLNTMKMEVPTQKLWRKTPLIRSSALSERTGHEVYLKIEVCPLPTPSSSSSADNRRLMEDYRPSRRVDPSKVAESLISQTKLHGATSSNAQPTLGLQIQ